MAVIFGCQAKMSGTVRRISCPLHGTQGQTADKIFFRCAVKLCQQFLQLLRMDFIIFQADAVTEVIDKGSKFPHPVRIRIIMGPVKERDFLPEIILCHGLIGYEHEILDDFRGRIPVIGFNIPRFSLLIQNNFRLREIKINGTSLLSLRPQKIRQFLHIPDHGDQYFVFCQNILITVQNLLYASVTHPSIYMDDGFRDHMIYHRSFFIHCHDAAHGQTIFSGIQGADSIGQSSWQHRNHPVYQIDTGTSV